MKYVLTGIYNISYIIISVFIYVKSLQYFCFQPSPRYESATCGFLPFRLHFTCSLLTMSGRQGRKDRLVCINCYMYMYTRNKKYIFFMLIFFFIISFTPTVLFVYTQLTLWKIAILMLKYCQNLPFFQKKSPKTCHFFQKKLKVTIFF